PLPRMSSWLNSRSDTNRGGIRTYRVEEETDTREVARYVKVDYNALPPFAHTEGPHLSPFPCMKQEYCPQRDSILVGLILSIALASCASNVRIVNETATGGTVL